MTQDEIAVKVEGALKTFGGKGSGWMLSLPRVSNGGGIPTGAKVAVNYVSLEIKRGEIFGVLGPNGSGKSTLIRLIATLLILDGGQIEVFGHDVQTEARQVQTLINRVSVEASFFKKLSPMENLIYGARLYGIPASETRRRAVEDEPGYAAKSCHCPKPAQQPGAAAAG
jgi:ABC-2 type transport system ATP-binding protein